MVINGWPHTLRRPRLSALVYPEAHLRLEKEAIDFVHPVSVRIKRKDGTWLDRGTGLRSKTSISNA